MTIGKFSWRQVVTFTICFLALGTPVEGQEEGIVVGVVPFVASSGVGNAASGVAERLVQRLTTSGLKDVRLLSNFESLGKNEVDAKEVERAAKESGVDLLVLGRAAKLGNRLSLDGEVRSGVTGQRIGTPFFASTTTVGPGVAGEAGEAVQGHVEHRRTCHRGRALLPHAVRSSRSGRPYCCSIARRLPLGPALVVM